MNIYLPKELEKIKDLRFFQKECVQTENLSCSERLLHRVEPAT